MKKIPKKFYIKKPVKVRKSKEANQNQIWPRPRLSWPVLRSPSIFRSIPVKFHRVLAHLDRFTLISFASGVLLVLFTIGLFDLNLDRKRLEIAKQKVVELREERDYWQQVVGEHKGYRDGYYMLAVSEYRLSNADEARVNVEKALELDPLFEQGKLFNSFLQP